MSAERYADEVARLRRFADVLELECEDGGRIAVVPAWQARVATSCVDPRQAGFGWLNHEFLESGAHHDKIHAYGGEDRIWLGPEAGQFSLFHDPGAAFDVAHWRTPALIDRDAYELVDASATQARFRHEASVVNWSGTRFELAIERTLRVLGRGRAGELLGAEIPSALAFVGVESENTLANRGDAPWAEEGGIPALWMIGMFRASATSTVVVPFRVGDEGEFGAVVNDRYFGAVPASRLAIDRDAGAIFFRADAQHRSKIGVSPRRARDRMGSYDPASATLTIVHYDLAPDAPYVDQMWEQQARPFAGDAVHSYNDGRWSDEVPQLGQFYELEASSPARPLAPGEAQTQRHRTMHFVGAREALDALARDALGVGLASIEAALPQNLG